MSVLREGDVVGGRYRLDRPLGAGGMGVVWAATHLVTHKTLALKFIHEKSDDPAARKRALREARAACAVSHPNVVTVHDVLEGEDGTPILVMDLLRGESLADRLAREGTIAIKDALAVARDVLGALSAAHDVGIVHRDLKPDNVFLSADGTVRILDFGVAKLKGQDAATKETNRLTETGAMIGTPHYMAPEQAFGESDVDLRADLWAVGAVLYECIAGVPPTNGQNLGQILKVLATGQIPPLRERVPDAPAEVAAIVDSLLVVERERRPASAAAVIAKIDAVKDAPADRLAVTTARAAERPDTPPPATRTTSPRESLSRRRLAFPLAAAVVVLGLAGVTVFTYAARGRAADAGPPRAIAEPVAPASAAGAAAGASSAPAREEASVAAATSAVPTASVAPLSRRPPPSRAPPTVASAPAASAKPAGSAAGPLLTTVPF